MSEANGTAVLDAPEMEEVMDVIEEQPQEAVAEVKEEPKSELKFPETQEDRDNLLKGAEREVRKAELKIAELSEELKIVKAVHKNAVSRVMKLIRNGEEEQTDLIHEPTSTTEATPATSWRETSIKDLDLSNHAVKAILCWQEDNPLLLSAGDLADWLHDAEDFKAEVYFSKAILEELAEVLMALQPPPAEVTDESWRDASIESIGISGGLLAAMIQADLSTVGKIADYTNAGNLLSDIKHVGPASVEKIEKAMEVFWASRAK